MCVYTHTYNSLTHICFCFFLPVEHNGQSSNEVFPDQSVHMCLILAEGMKQAW